MTITRYIAAFCIFMVFCTSPAWGADLLDVYRDALNNDPTFKAAESYWRLQRENLPIARAALLPHISLNAHGNFQHSRAKLGQNIAGIVGSTRLTSSTHPYGYGASLEQPLFNFPAWFQLKNARAVVKQAHATYFVHAQELILRVAERYFAVLEAQDNLNFVRAEKKAVNQQRKRVTARYKVGLATITAFYDAKARYDLMIAQEIAAKNTLTNRIEELREVTGYYYKHLASIDKHLPLLPPQPANIRRWVRVAMTQNYELVAARHALAAAHALIQRSTASHALHANIIGSFNAAKGGDTSTIGASSTETRRIGLELTLPILQGGLISAQTRQAQYDYQRISHENDALLRGIISKTRKSYLGVMAHISKIKADVNVIHSDRSALKANRAGYANGTRTMIDVLNSQAELYRAQKDLSADLYQYLLDTLRLKLAAGRLCADDLAFINRWLISNKT